jgi:hypothetical protein
VRLGGAERQRFRSRTISSTGGGARHRATTLPIHPAAADGDPLGVRDGRLDARAGTSPFVIDVLFGSENRREYIASALRNLATPVAVGTVLDAVSQYQIFEHVRPLGALFVGFGVLGVPYALARGLTNRFAAPRHPLSASASK